MAPRTGDKRLLTPTAKGTSAGIIPALVLAALLALSGCGGGSSEETASSPPSTSATTTQEEGQGEGGKNSSSASEGAKQGSSIKPPKGPREEGPSEAQREQATVADISLTSPAIPGQKLPATYTCDGENTWPQLDWKGIPPETQELVLFTMSLQPVKGELFFDWALAGIDPSLEQLESGKLPDGAVVGTNSSGKQAYSICPPASKAENYVFALYALPQSLSPKPGFDARELRDQVLEESGNVGLQAALYSRE